MIRARLRAWLMRVAFGADPAPLLETLRRAVAAVQATRAEQHELGRRVELLEQSAVVAIGPEESAAVRKHADPYLAVTGVLLCTAADARVLCVRPLERMTVA